MNKTKKESTEIKLPVPWGHIAAKQYGPSKEKKILMVHGILDNAGTFDRLMEDLPEDYHYVNIDLPGHGLSSPFPAGTPLHFFDYVYTIQLVLNALKWKTCTYMGHSFGVHIGTYYSILYPGRLEKMIALDGFLPFIIRDIISYIQKTYDLDAYTKDPGYLFTKEEVIYTLQFRRKETLNMDAAEALFERAVTKVGDLYKYNRDTRLRRIIRPLFTIQQHKDALKRYSTKTLLIIADNSSRINSMTEVIEAILADYDKSKFTMITVRGNHDVHNNYPERVVPYICKFLNENNLQSRL